jgi:methylmalonyl-CoA mutase N-terminal domain/subunit
MSDEERADPTVPPGIHEGRRRWEKAVEKTFASRPPWKRDFTTVSGAEVDPLAGPDSIPGFDPERDLGWPGEYPFTRGVVPTMYWASAASRSTRSPTWRFCSTGSTSARSPPR